MCLNSSAAESEVRRRAGTNLIFNAVDAMAERRDSHVCAPACLGSQARLPRGERYRARQWMKETRRRCLGNRFYTTKGEARHGPSGLAMVYGMIQRHSAELENRQVNWGGGHDHAADFHASRLPDYVGPSGLGTGGSLPPQSPRCGSCSSTTIRFWLQSLPGHAGRATGNAIHCGERRPGGGSMLSAAAALASGNAVRRPVVTDLGMPYVDGRKSSRLGTSTVGRRSPS